MGRGGRGSSDGVGYSRGQANEGCVGGATLCAILVH